LGIDRHPLCFLVVFLGLVWESLEEKFGISSDFSHSLSHHSFGEFTQTLLTEFPKLFDKNPLSVFDSHQSTTPFLNCFVAGENFESIINSLILTSNQKNNEVDLFCDFNQDKYFFGQHYEIFHHLTMINQMMIRILNYKLKNNQKITLNILANDICQKFNQHYEHKFSHQSQIDLLESKAQGTYDRVILNLRDFPKNNPHHYLLNKISECFILQERFDHTWGDRVFEKSYKFRNCV
jgi:hypothetical protein